MSNNLELIKASDQKYCSACAKIIHASADSCPFCGAKQSQVALQGQPNQTQGQQTKAADQKFCSACGNILHHTAELCPKCGAKQLIAGSSLNVKNKTTAGILALFLGGIGVHKFYLGRSGWGLIYLLFCWTFIPGVVGLIEGTYYLTMDENKFHERVRLGII